jgi:tellurite resistance protein TehA-like permease
VYCSYSFGVGALVLTDRSVNAHKVDLSDMTPLWLLPVLPAVICSTTGGIIAPVLADAQHQLWTLIISYVLWGMSFPLAVLLLVVYFYRLIVFDMLDKEVIVSVFLPVGPFGLGGFS